VLEQDLLFAASGESRLNLADLQQAAKLVAASAGANQAGNRVTRAQIEAPDLYRLT